MKIIPLAIEEARRRDYIMTGDAVGVIYSAVFVGEFAGDE